MNPRIRELMEQARKEELGNIFPQDVYKQEAVQQRLVQLVVLECARWLGNREFASPEALKQHFGVDN